MKKIIKWVSLKRKSKMFILSSVLVLLSIVTSLSYGVFVIQNSGYRVSELFVGKLLYTISIEEDGNNATINGKSITVPANTKVYINVTVGSLNKVESKYQISYKVSDANTLVYYSDKTSWKPAGLMYETGSVIDSKKVRLVIENNSSSSSTVEIEVNGGYTFNEYSEIILGSNYERVSNEYSEQVAVTSSVLSEIVEIDNGCETNSECIYGGEAENNHVQYPESSNKSENIWRIVGNYDLGEEVVTKLIANEISTTSTYNNAVSNLTTIYNGLEDQEDYIYETNKFICTSNNWINK